MQASSLFCPPGKPPLCFFLDSRVPAETATLIEQNGGEVSQLLRTNTVHLVSLAVGTVLGEKLSHPVYSHEFVGDSVRLCELLDLSLYRVKSTHKPVQRRNAYSYQEERRMAEFVQAQRNPTVSSVAFWRKAREALGCKHSADSLRYHYLRVTSKMRFDTAGDESPDQQASPAYRPAQPLEIVEGNAVIQVSVWPNTNVIRLPNLKRTAQQEATSSPPRKSLIAPSGLPLPLSPEADHCLASGFSSLTLSPPVPPAEKDLESYLEKFQKLAYFCRQFSMSQLSDREVLRMLLMLDGDIAAVLRLYCDI